MRGVAKVFKLTYKVPSTKKTVELGVTLWRVGDVDLDALVKGNQDGGNKGGNLVG